MTLTENGINYIAQKFGDINECVISQGLTWNYEDIEGTTHEETGGTSSAVSRLIFTQLVVSLTMIDPPRGTFTYNQLRAANNGQDITLSDCAELDNHDENSGDQWCYVAPVPCEGRPQAECIYPCYWWGDPPSCHSEPAPSEPNYIPLLIAAAGIGILTIGGYIIYRKRRR